MAISYKKGDKEMKYTGIDKVTHKFGNALERIKSGAKRVATRIPRAMEAKRKGDAQREIQNIERAFGSVENYQKMYPDTRKRNDRLRQTAGF